MLHEPARTFVLCADDFALTEGVSIGILELMAAGRLPATSVMTTRPAWPRLAERLRDFDGRVAVGLHLNLTLGRPLGAMPVLAPGGELPGIGRLIGRAFLGRVPPAEVETQIGRQLNSFEDALGRVPDFIDGHEHVHVLPGVRSSLLAVLAGRAAGRPWLRDPADRPSAILRRGAPAKSTVIAGLAAGFAAAAGRAGLLVNQGFSGVSAFDLASDYGAEFARSLVAPGPRHLVMCHPGRSDAELEAFDPIAGCRERELAFFASGRYLEVCADAKLVPAPAWG